MTDEAATECPFCDVTHGGCIDESALVDLGCLTEGDLPHDRLLALVAHLARCPACLETLASMVIDMRLEIAARARAVASVKAGLTSPELAAWAESVRAVHCQIDAVTLALTAHNPRFNAIIERMAAFLGAPWQESWTEPWPEPDAGPTV